MDSYLYIFKINMKVTEGKTIILLALQHNIILEMNLLIPVGWLDPVAYKGLL